MEEVLFKYHGSGEWNSLHVELTPTHLFVESHHEGKAEGDHFAMMALPSGDAYVVTWDETSFPVPGSECLWLDAAGFQGWTKEALDGLPNPVMIPRIAMLDAVRRYTESWKAILQEDDGTWTENDPRDDNYFSDHSTNAKVDKFGIVVHNPPPPADV
jgi:hypothetical protein